MEPSVPRAALAMMEVETIVAASFGENGKRCYKVQWRESWVFEDHLFGCKDLVNKFWKDQKSAEELVMQETQEQDSATNGVGIKRDFKGEAKKEVTTTVIVIGNKDVQPPPVSDSVPSNSEIDGDWMLDGLATDEDTKENESWFVTSQSKKLRPPGSKYTLTCHLCSDVFELVSAFRRHYNDSHPGVKPFACDMCSKRFDRKENLSRHIRIHTGDRRYVCNFCGKGYTDPSGLKKHVVSKHSDTSKFTCDICQAIFNTKELYSKHIAKHLPDFKLKTLSDNKKVDDEEDDEQSEVDIATRKPLLENNTREDADATIEVLMENSPTNAQSGTSSDAIEINTSDSGHIKEQPLQRVVHQIQQYVDGGQVVQYVQVSAHSTSSNHEHGNTGLSPTDTLSAGSAGKPFLFPANSNSREHFVMPITTPQILSLNAASGHRENAHQHQVLPVQVTGDQQTQIITVPIVSTQAFVYTGSITEAGEQRDEILPSHS